MRQNIIHDPAKISWILNQCNILHLGLTNEHGTYVVPVHYDFTQQQDGNFVIYIHGTGDGQKAAALDKEQSIGLKFDSDHTHLIYTPPKARSFNPPFMSVIGNGVPARLTDPQKKAIALREIVHHYVAKSPVMISPEADQPINVWRITTTRMTARINNPFKEWQEALHISKQQSRGKHYNPNGDLLFDDFADQPADNGNEPSDASTGASSTDDQ